MTNLLAVDVGNTNTVLGYYAGDELAASWRMETNAGRTADEYAVAIRELMSLDGFDWRALTAGIISTVVPTALYSVESFFRRHLDIAALVVGPGVKSGMPILYENPREVGADRIANSVAAYEKVKGGVIAVDFGTATTWDVISPKGEYMGGVIAPGIQISAEALHQHAAKLPRVELVRPGRVVGRNPAASMQSGLLFGYAGMVDAVVDRICEEVPFTPHCMATGGLASLIAKESRTIVETDPLLTLKGLKLLFDRNR